MKNIPFSIGSRGRNVEFIPRHCPRSNQLSELLTRHQNVASCTKKSSLHGEWRHRANLIGLLASLLTVLLWISSPGGSIFADVLLTSPGFAPSKIDNQGRLVEDWGMLEVNLEGQGITKAVPKVESIQLDQIVPAASARWDAGAVVMEATAFRAPVWPDGLDVLTLRLQETAGQAQTVKLSLVLPAGAHVGSRTASLQGRGILVLPEGSQTQQTQQEWGWDDDAQSLPGWARPSLACDPAFRNIRAGLGGVPIRYAFKVEPRSACQVVLGFCESHWADAGARPVVCKVEGADVQEVDPLARWGQHVPGALAFQARDENGDGKLDVSVLPSPGAPDQNPILNIIWIFPPTEKPDLAQVTAGRLNERVLRYVDVGGANDQSLYRGGKIEYFINLQANGAREFTLLAACPGGSTPLPGKTAWTIEKLRQAARDVWRGWAKK